MTALPRSTLDTRRKIYLARGGVSDLAPDCVVTKDADFDVEKSIFAILDEPIKSMIADGQLKPYWSDRAVERTAREFAGVRRPPRPEEQWPKLIKFMAEECDFRVEHADGSFMDHLTFCHDYCAQYYPGASALPLFVHSIMGVGTNIFPMAASKIPQLRTLVTPDEFDHLQAFPSVLRILQNFTLLDELRAGLRKQARVRGLRFHRLIDNAPIELSAEQLWVSLPSSHTALCHTAFGSRGRTRAGAPELPPDTPDGLPAGRRLDDAPRRAAAVLPPAQAAVRRGRAARAHRHRPEGRAPHRIAYHSIP